MPMYDRRCDTCGLIKEDCYESIRESDPPCSVDSCNGTLERVHLQRSSAVIGDEIDVWIKHGLCHEDGSPRRFRSRTELDRERKRLGWTNYVTSERTPGPDRHRHTVS